MNLYQAIKNFINSVGEGNEFTTKQLTDAVDPYVNKTRWNVLNNNPFYRVHSYKSMIKKAGLITQVDRGLFRVERLIPDEVTLTDFQYASGYTSTYVNTKEGWVNKPVKKNPFDFAAYLRGEIQPEVTFEENKVFGDQFTQEASPTYKTSYHAALQFMKEETEKAEAEEASRVTDNDSFDEIGNEIWNEVKEEITKDMKVGTTVYIVDRHDEPDGSTYFSIIKDKIKSIITTETEKEVAVGFETESGELIQEMDLPAVFTDKKEMLAYVEMIS
jgi:hypothetical protein